MEEPEVEAPDETGGELGGTSDEESEVTPADGGDTAEEPTPDEGAQTDDEAPAAEAE